MARIFEPIQLGSIELFCKAAEVGSFANAAELLGVTPAAVSRSIGRLEARLGVRLFVRTTRRIRLTADGELYRAECQQALEQIADAERAITGNQRMPTGVLRISVPTTYAHYRLLPLIPRFNEAFPMIELDIDISNQNIDFVDEGYDLAIRLGTPPHSQLIARRLEDARLGVFASPSYLKRRGKPTSLAELPDHDCIQFVLPSTGRPVPWLFKGDDGQDLEIALHGRHSVRGDVLGCVNLARAGVGIFQIYDFIGNAAVERGELVEILQSAGGRTRPFSVVYPHNRHLPARVRLFVDFLISTLSAQQPAMLRND